MILHSWKYKNVAIVVIFLAICKYLHVDMSLINIIIFVVLGFYVISKSSNIIRNASSSYLPEDAKTLKEDLEAASLRLTELEEKLFSLEAKVPKKYPEVKFLNYVAKKRILVGW